ncbi:MAG: hypothetical protein HC884_05020, partial [Chloroflexaceae bacterium]|nr:hypothetical protein [Chloroflexaceae bacterium]
KPAKTGPPQAREQERSPPQRKPEPAPVEPELRPDASAILERLQRQRQQQQEATGPASKQDSNSSLRRTEEREPFPVQPQFQAGDHIFCRPYGNGVVRTSRVENGHELLEVEFPEYGRLEINPSVSLVRRIEKGEKKGCEKKERESDDEG